jgi:predicted nucleotidyltransferase
MEFREVFRRVSEVLDSAVVPYMLTGSFVSSYYGVLRATHDIDIVIAPTQQSLKTLVSQLNEKDYYADLKAATDAHRELSMFNALDNQTGWKVDFIFCKSSAYAREAFQRRKSVNFHETRIFVASVEDVIVSKLEWAKMGESARQVEDVAAVFKKQHAAVDHSYVEKWVTELGLNSEWARARQFAGLE